MEKKNKKSYLIVFLSISAILITFYYGQQQKFKLNKNKVYSTAKIIDSYAIVGSFNIKYEYKYENKIYVSKNGSQKSFVNYIGKKYIVKFSSKNPNNSTLMVNFPICDTVTVAPQLGWKELPKHLICKD